MDFDPAARLCYLLSRGVDAVFYPRPSSTDNVVLDEVYAHDTYRLGDTDCDGLVIDVGANIGAFAVAAAKLSGRVVAVEPDGEAVKAMERHLAANGVEAEILVGALGGAAGSSYFRDDGSGSASQQVVAVPEGAALIGEPVRGEPVDVTTLDAIVDAYAADAEPICLLKIDCEGAEYDIIRATSDATLYRVRRIALEFHGPIQLRHPVEPGSFGMLIERLSGFFQMEWSGRPDVGGMLYGRSYTTPAA